jgi:hypothetical protein
VRAKDACDAEILLAFRVIYCTVSVVEPTTGTLSLELTHTQCIFKDHCKFSLPPGRVWVTELVGTTVDLEEGEDQGMQACYPPVD